MLNHDELAMLRPLAEALSPDPRFTRMAVADARKGIRQITFDDHYGAIDAIQIAQTVPSNVRGAFDRSRSCFLYAWFAYELMVVAEAQALAGLELALKERLAPPPPGKKRPQGLGGRLSAAVDQGLLAPPKPTADQPDRYFIVKTIRDELAHGSEDIHSPTMALDVIRLCAELIAELYSSIDR